MISIRNKNAREGDGCNGRLLLKDVATARENVQEFFRVYQEVINVEIEYDHVPYKLEDICIRSSNASDCLVPDNVVEWIADCCLFS